MDNVARAQEALHRVLVEIDWARGREPAAGCRIPLGGPGVPVSDVILGIEQGTRLFLLLANLADATRADRRADVARCVNRANWDLMLGNFEMDERTGAVRFRCGVHFGEDDLAESAIRRTIVTAMGLIEAHAGAIHGAIAGRDGP